MSAAHTVFQYFWDIEISQFSNSIHKKYIRTFDISMSNLILMEQFEPLQDLESNFPDKILLKTLLFVNLKFLIDFVF